MKPGPMTIESMLACLEGDHNPDRPEVKDFWQRFHAAIIKGEKATVMAMTVEVIQWNVGEISWPLFLAICRTVEQVDRQRRMCDEMAQYEAVNVDG